MPPRGTAPGLSITDGDARYQPLDSDLTAIAALSTTSFGRALLALADAAAGRLALLALGGSLGSTDNVVPRTDGTAGYTLQSSGLVIGDDNQMDVGDNRTTPRVKVAWSSGVGVQVDLGTLANGDYDVYLQIVVERSTGVRRAWTEHIFLRRTAGTLTLLHNVSFGTIGAFGPTLGYGVSGDDLVVTITSAGAVGNVAYTVRIMSCGDLTA